MTWAQLESDTIDVRPLHERVYDVLMKRMIAGTLSAGERLDAAEIAQTLGVSRTPVKEALNRLAFEGLVAIQARRGTSVSIPTESELSELYDVMRMIGSHTVDDALAHKTPAAVAELKALLKNWQSEIDGDRIRDYSAYLQRDREFHTFLVELAGMPKLADIYRSTGLKIRLAYTLDSQHSHNLSESNAQHLEILTAFENGSAGDLRAAIKRHYHTPTALITRSDKVDQAD
jgi:DNA-binding GntR family transcriptional regulator